MPKMKTRSSIVKRFKITKRGKVISKGRANTSHIMSKKNAKRRRRLRHGQAVDNAQARTVRREMGA